MPIARGGVPLCICVCLSELLCFACYKNHFKD